MSSVLQLIRFVTDGLRDTIDSFATGTLPLHRCAWELQSRLNSLAELVDRRTLAPLRSSQRTVATIDTALRETGRTGMTSGEERILASALATMRAELDRLTTPSHTADVVALVGPAVPARAA